MEFRQAIETDINNVMKIINGAQGYLKQSGVNQWQNNYPNIETIKNDIDNQNGYVLLINNIIVGTVAVIFDGEKTYDSVYNGKWLSNSKYAVIHRIAVDASNKGLASIMIKHIEEMCLRLGISSIKIDTHGDNISMQKLLDKNGFKYCGEIYLEDNSKRIAFEKIIES